MKKVINLMLSTSLLIASFENVTSSYSYAENIQKESVENVENKIDLTDPMTSIINQDLSSSDLSDQDTGAYTSSLLHTGNETSYYGGEIINFYNNISVSGNVTRLEEGAHIVISIPKDVFQKPELKNISSSYELIKGVEIKETEKDWQIVTTYKEIHGGYNGATPFKINFLEKQIINKSEATVKQEFYDKNENLLAEDSVIVYGKSEIEKPSSSVYSAQRLRNEVDSNYVIKENTYASFNYNSLNKPLENRDDPRDRRVYATIPEGTKVKEGTGWSFDQMNNRYYWVKIL